MISQLPTEEALIQMLEESGLPTFDAREAAQEIIKSSAEMMPGVTFGGVDLAEIPEIVTRATRAGVKSLTLTIQCAGEKYEWHDFTVLVRQTQHWNEPEKPTLEEQIKTRINQLEADYKHILDRSLENIHINAPVALMQITAKGQLDELYRLLNSTRPEFPCDTE